MADIRDIDLDLIDLDPELIKSVTHTQAEIVTLLDSMSHNGQRTPILLRPIGSKYILVHGMLRYLVAKRLGWETVRAEIRPVDPSRIKWTWLTENVKDRADEAPTPIYEEGSFDEARSRFSRFSGFGGLALVGFVAVALTVAVIGSRRMGQPVEPTLIPTRPPVTPTLEITDERALILTESPTPTRTP